MVFLWFSMVFLWEISCLTRSIKDLAGQSVVNVKGLGRAGTGPRPTRSTRSGDQPWRLLEYPWIPVV